MEPSVEVAIIIFLVLIAHYLIFYFLTRKKKNIDGKLKTAKNFSMFIQNSKIKLDN